jgi:hypothetical protein
LLFKRVGEVIGLGKKGRAKTLNEDQPGDQAFENDPAETQILFAS